jgi:hypothetical protein
VWLIDCADFTQRRGIFRSALLSDEGASSYIPVAKNIWLKAAGAIEGNELRKEETTRTA